MSMRTWMEEHRGLVTLAAVLLLAASIGVGFWQLRPSYTGGLPQNAWFYDTESKELFPASIHELPSIPGPSKKVGADGAPTGVRAYVYTCGGCGPKERFIGYLENFTPEAKQARADGEKVENGEMPSNGTREMIGVYQAREAEGRMVTAAPRDGTAISWVTLASPEGGQIAIAPLSKCGEGKKSKECFPD